jgi:hypothetical protein
MSKRAREDADAEDAEGARLLERAHALLESEPFLPNDMLVKELIDRLSVSQHLLDNEFAAHMTLPRYWRNRELSVVVWLLRSVSTEWKRRIDKAPSRIKPSLANVMEYYIKYDLLEDFLALHMPREEAKRRAATGQVPDEGISDEVPHKAALVGIYRTTGRLTYSLTKLAFALGQSLLRACQGIVDHYSKRYSLDGDNFMERARKYEPVGAFEKGEGRSIISSDAEKFKDHYAKVLYLIFEKDDADALRLIINAERRNFATNPLLFEIGRRKAGKKCAAAFIEMLQSIHFSPEYATACLRMLNDETYSVFTLFTRWDIESQIEKLGFEATLCALTYFPMTACTAKYVKRWCDIANTRYMSDYRPIYRWAIRSCRVDLLRTVFAHLSMTDDIRDSLEESLSWDGRRHAGMAVVTYAQWEETSAYCAALNIDIFYMGYVRYAFTLDEWQLFAGPRWMDFIDLASLVESVPPSADYDAVVCTILVNDGGRNTSIDMLYALYCRDTPVALNALLVPFSDAKLLEWTNVILRETMNCDSAHDRYGDFAAAMLARFGHLYAALRHFSVADALRGPMTTGAMRLARILRQYEKQ